jgi:hypothetical protein
MSVPPRYTATYYTHPWLKFLQAYSNLEYHSTKQGPAIADFYRCLRRLGVTRAHFRVKYQSWVHSGRPVSGAWLELVATGSD